MTNKAILAKSVLAAVAGLGLAACEPPSSPNAFAGETSAPAANAGGLFQQVCVANQNQLAEAPKLLAQLPFTRNSTEDIYYHNTFNLSFKLTAQPAGALCSMVWSSPNDAGTNRATILSVAPGAVFRDVDNGLLSSAIIGAL